MNKIVIAASIGSVALMTGTELPREISDLLTGSSVSEYISNPTALYSAVSSASLGHRAQIWTVVSAIAGFLIARLRRQCLPGCSLWPEMCCLGGYLTLLYAGLWCLFGHDVPLNVLSGLSLVPVSVLLGWLHALLQTTASEESEN